MRGEESSAELRRREGIARSVYYSWPKEFLEAFIKHNNHQRCDESFGNVMPADAQKPTTDEA